MSEIRHHPQCECPTCRPEKIVRPATKEEALADWMTSVTFLLCCQPEVSPGSRQGLAKALEKFYKAKP